MPPEGVVEQALVQNAMQVLSKFSTHLTDTRLSLSDNLRWRRKQLLADEPIR
jgi:hypothetical protein